ncbi:bifunctional phosphoribosyl-AMP cyclohydrolase/phosphoribosyl-ATP diphosphatase HisIE [Chloracidobacterium sp. MS 40/45]|uniref:bifunctional phosphoribosyl-AMP cyclohydrolase/phosphoribosyl-ATP diphosphatase HisIE n=1 Tax=Chloracidobacterium aggregatum TaxID=2851959 RepID=UPI001B8C47EA|nr:bifunctional phosphoribosyl-AMP cyclohydrolase/phosphoribosyl-ATP diphosphatase HisIE [Chloracidobacterium aggregatum]QUW00838.1 bifunctional phosphoribosyl-AMP cyclohydrolase/phosphoribosyl-ATP diphosphatase HisIE [Chloracidobacterium sp. MS 40/45]
MTEAIRFDANGLVPVVIQDATTNEVLTLAYMNATSYQLTCETGEVWLWSRSRQSLWHKGATSGHTQRVVDIRLDCDGDALVVRVEPRGPACHTGATSCFFQSLLPSGTTAKTDEGPPAAQAPDGTTAIAPPEVRLVPHSALELGILLDELYALIRERQAKRPEGAYTTYLFTAGLDKILKKVGEEAAETIIAAKNEPRMELAAEMADLLYHLLVLMVARDVTPHDVAEILRSRAGKRRPLPTE